MNHITEIDLWNDLNEELISLEEAKEKGIKIESDETLEVIIHSDS